LAQEEELRVSVQATIDLDRSTSEDIAGSNPTAPSNPITAARNYSKRGWVPIPIPLREKAPRLRDWPKLRLTEQDLPAHFGGRPQNVGVLLGEPSGGLVDVDLDSPDAAKLADDFLPPTDSVFGRPSKPRSHRLYLAAPIPKTERFEGIDSSVLVELRSTGSQTIFPPSLHPSGEVISFEKDGQPAAVDGLALRERVARLAAATLLLKQWPMGAGSRQEIALALAGGLLGNGWNTRETEEFIHAIARTAGDNEAAKRAEAALYTEKSLKAGEHVTGWPRLAALMGSLEVTRVASWLKLRQAGRKIESYRATLNGLVWDKSHRDSIPLTNFTARIVGEVLEDDGAETRRRYEIEAQLRDKTRKAIVPAEQFGSMAWVAEYLGAGAVVYPGFGVKEHARTAIQMLSGEVPERRVFAHTGWRRIEDDWVYLHGGGAIGRDGPVPNVHVNLPDPLARFVLPTPPEGDDLKKAVLASLHLLKVAPETITFPILAATYRAVVGECDFSLHVSGDTGVGKTGLAALAQQHFGCEMDARNLPGSWSSTANATESLAFAAKDALLVLDDFSPQGSQTDVQRLHREADRILRAQGNRSSRLRMRADTSLRQPKPPRGLILSTGEDIPRGQSLRARLLTLEMSPSSVDWSGMTDCQAEAASGLYAQALAGFIHWLATRYTATRTSMRMEIAKLRNAASREGQHRRSAEIVANLSWGLRLFLDFAVDVGAISQSEGDGILTQGEKALDDVAGLQSAQQRESDPALHSIELLKSALASGRGHLANEQGGNPAKNPEKWGWRLRVQGAYEEWIPMGPRVGWVNDQGEVLLEPHAWVAAVQEVARSTGETIPISAAALAKRLKERGLLITTDRARQTRTVRRTLEGVRRSVLHLRLYALAIRREKTLPDAKRFKGSLARARRLRRGRVSASPGSTASSPQRLPGGTGSRPDMASMVFRLVA
jgi:hypothetical protein